jgi:hypothetical protein
MTKERSLFSQFFVSNPSRAEREEKVLRYIVHRLGKDAALEKVLQEPYVQRTCSQIEIEEIQSNPELVQAAREHMEHAFESGELDPKRRR